MSTDMAAPLQAAKRRRRARIQMPQLGLIEIVDALAIGRRSTTLRGRCSAGRDVVLKLFAPSSIAKHARRHPLPLARYEYERNLALWSVDSLRGCVAKPLGFAGEGRRQIFVQEFVDGMPLEMFAAHAGDGERRAISKELARIVSAAHDAEFFDLDLHPGNVLVRSRRGSPRVMLFDFDRIPYHVRPPNPVAKLLVSCGLITARSRDLRRLQAIDKMLSSRADGSSRLS